MQYFVQGLGVAVGVVIGTIVGTIINLALFKYGAYTLKKQRVKNLEFEFRFNIRKIDDFINELVKYRNAVNGDNLNKYYGYFNLAAVIYPTMNAMYNDGSLYDYVDYEDIVKLQQFVAHYSLTFQERLNYQINWAKRKQKQSGEQYTKAEIVSDIDFWDNIFDEDKNSLNTILKKLVK